MSRTKINWSMLNDFQTKERFQQLVQEDRDIMDESVITLEEILERDLLSSFEEEDFGDNS